MRRLDTLTVRVFLLLMIGISLAAVLAFAASDYQQRRRARIEREERLIERVVDAVTLLSTTPPGRRPAQFGLGPEALRPTAAGEAPADADLSARLNDRLGRLAHGVISVPQTEGCEAAHPAPAGPLVAVGPIPPPPPPPPPGPPPCRRLTLRLADGEAVYLVAPTGPRLPKPSSSLGPLALGIVALGAALLAWLTARIATAPVARLARAALALGDDLDRPPLSLEGPAEVGRAAKAFNTMQARLRQGLEERMQMLAAITHDLQTPLTRHRLRLEQVADERLREQLLADLAAMQGLVREGLDLARQSHEAEPLEPLDVDSLLDSLADDAVSAGHKVRVSARCGAILETRPLALGRCLTNLVDNAIKYAGACELSADRIGGGVSIAVRDTGPGIPAADLTRMLEPFQRGEGSRSRQTGGAGLGLTIAKRLAERSGGELYLRLREGGGLEAKVSFPPRASHADQERPA